MQEEIKKTLAVLEQGGIILYPTDTVWGIGCDATNAVAIEKVYALKKRASEKALICLVSDDYMLEQHVEQVPDLAYDIIDLSTRPTTIIYDAPKGIAKNLIAEDNSLAIRVASDKFCQYLIKAFKKPLVSTSANIAGQATPSTFKEITDDILKGVDYVVNLDHDKEKKSASTIIKLGNDGVIKVIRK
ncbi:L-threonylcarbamoyladenylate synthase [Muriicola sp. Z0-33]|uniref:L-threonylcarbamoyladenylate synthase n=1 Tax=Muriicola sp. Z0-33 TaxID=2816957 RepID=UPI002237A516|nr:L-threonylcarbamoyladenylate synthase [Muriicola sp. Z0-33]MCW5515961.1 threonylcarbamoyl-AMP synthase [Muriicola sp. Z0-33]